MTGGVLIVGAGPIGLATGMLLARDGHQVTIVERDAQTHPATGLEASGGRRFNLLDALPPSIGDRTRRQGDERFEIITARRPVIESAFAQAAEDTPGVRVVRGVAIDGPVTGRSVRKGIPHVTGVRTSDGAEIHADLVVDAMGRRSKVCDSVTSIGGRHPYEESADAGFVYHTRHHRSLDGSKAALTPWYRQQIDRDHERAAEIRALVEGRPAAPPADDPATRMQAAFFTAANTDADVARALLEIVSCLALPTEIMSRPGWPEKVAAFAGAQPAPMPGPTRAQLLSLIAEPAHVVSSGRSRQAEPWAEHSASRRAR